MINITNYKTKEIKLDILKVSDWFKDILESCVNNFFSNKNLFTKENISIYSFDDLSLKTNVTKNIITTFYVEINQPANYKVKDSKFKFHFFKNDDILPDLYLTLHEIKKGIFNSLINNLTEEFVLYEKKQSIFIDFNREVSDNVIQTYYFEVIPCITFVNRNNVNGVMYYTDNFKEITIDYPKISMENFALKNTRTNNKLLETVIIFKNILLKEHKYEEIPFEFVETLCFNVPDELFMGTFNSAIFKIVNYMRNIGLLNIKTIDGQDCLFTSKYKSFSLLYAKKILKNISDFVSKNK